MTKKIKKGHPDKRIKRWQRLQYKDRQENERKSKLDDYFYNLGRIFVNRRADDGGENEFTN